MSEYHPLSVVEVEQRLVRINAALGSAVKELAERRKEELAALREFKRAKAKAMFDPACPEVSRGGATVAERDAWVDDKTEEEWHAHAAAEIARESARDHLNVLREQASTLQTIAAGQRTLMKLGV